MASQANCNAEFPTCDNDDDECCPICYELFVVSSFSTQPSVSGEDESGISTESIHCNCFDDDSNDDISDEINDETLTNSSSSNSSIYSEDQTKSVRKSCFCHQQHRHPREKVIIPGCGHGYCRGCLKDHCSYAISVRDLPIRCPKFSGDSSCQLCSVVLPIGIVRESLLTKDATNPDWAKFQRLQRMLEDPSLIPCTRCDELVSPKQSSSSSSSNNNEDDQGGSDRDPNRILCPACQHVFCRIHGDGHLGRDCTTEANLRREKVDPSEKAIHELCKPCSHCGVPICKKDGCHHVICPICKDDMCFRCGTHRFLENKNGSMTVRTCNHCKKSYFDHRYLWRHRLGILAKLPLMLPIYICYMVTTLALATATFGCFCCLGCGVRREKTKPNATKRATQQDVSNRQQQQKQKRCASNKSTAAIVWMPIMAMREVLGWIFLPFIDLFREYRLPCCFCHNAPGLCQGSARDDDENHDTDDEHETMQSDVENQIG